MRILFIYPIIGTGEIPLNLSYLTSVCKREGHQVKVFDTSAYRKFSSRVDSGQTSVGQFKRFKNRIKFPLKDTDPSGELLELVRTFKPETICVTSFTNNYKVGLDLLNEVKAKYDIPTLFGGVHTTLVPEQVIAEPSVDMICVGEGEGLMVDLFGGMDKSLVKNLWYKENGEIRKNAVRKLLDLDTLPYQDFDEYEEYNFYRPLAGKLYRSVSVDVSRGCPYRCSYCVNHTFQSLYKGLGKYHRVKSIERAIGNLIYLKNRYHPELIRFWDEDFTTLPLNYIKEFSEEYICHINLPFLIYARVDTISEAKLKLLKRMGCITIAMGIESGNKGIREKVLNRHMTNEKIEESFRLVKKLGIRCTAYNMIGLPHETRENIFETIELNKKCKPNSSSIAFLEPYQNTEIFNDCVRNGYIPPDYMATFDFFNPHISEIKITHEELRGILRTFMIYVKAPKFLWPLIKLCERKHRWLYKILLLIFKGS